MMLHIRHMPHGKSGHPRVCASETHCIKQKFGIMQGGVLLQGKKISTLQVGFATNATVYDSTPTQSDISSEVTGTGNSTSSSSISCSEECAIYNLTCAIKKKCYSRIALFFGYIGIALVVGEPPFAAPPNLYCIYTYYIYTYILHLSSFLYKGQKDYIYKTKGQNTCGVKDVMVVAVVFPTNCTCAAFRGVNRH